MKYRELIHFQPVETVVQLRHAEAMEQARSLVETFVISDRMADQLSEVVIPQLQFEAPADQKGVLIVGNYGTGKSHLMSVLSAICEHAELADVLTHEAVRTKAAQIAGRFAVIRAEIGATTQSLRDILCGVLEDGLARLGVTFAFPGAGERHENKTVFQEMMAAFQAENPDQGLLLVLDELLDYLRSRDSQQLSLDLSFLRELGEVCRDTRFRFLSGVQETLFDNPRFQFVADTLRRVRDRFEQLRIVREDVAFVVAERILKKDGGQEARIREHLQPFTPLYGSMNERLDDFVRLFPVHPAYLETFERVHVAEKREVLRTLSASIRRLLDTEVPSDQPGLVAYDSYWQTLKDNASFRTEPDIRAVIEKSDVLAGRIQQAFTRPAWKPVAQRIIEALSVHRLTTGGIDARLGVTAEELRDDLCLMLPVPERDAEFLKNVVESVLKEILRTVSGQFLAFNPENGQYFLDLKKDTDYDALIERRAESLSPSQLDGYYFEALGRVVLADPDAQTYVSGHRIWEHEIEWRERKAGRSGYLFFGAPNERTTAQPPRDFYLYFLQLFEAPAYTDEKKADEVFFRLQHRDEAFDRALRLYGAARDLGNAASGTRKVYDDKAAEHLRTLTGWLRERAASSLAVTHQGKTRSLAETVHGKIPGGLGRVGVAEMVQAAGAACLEPAFRSRSPDYPIFGVSVGRENRAQAAQDALRSLAGGVRSKHGSAVLEALELMDGDRPKPRESRYAKQVLDLLGQKKHGQVVNRSELVRDEAGVEYWQPFRVEPEFLVVVLASLVHSGDVLLAIPGRKLDAGSIEDVPKIPFRELLDFKHIERPGDLPVGALEELFGLLELPEGLVRDPARREEGVAQLQSKITSWTGRVVEASAQLGGLSFWGRSLVPEGEEGEWRRQLEGLKSFLESLQAMNTVGKLKGFRHEAQAVIAQRQALASTERVEALAELRRELEPYGAYLGKAEALMPKDHPWVVELQGQRRDLLRQVHGEASSAQGDLRRALTVALGKLKKGFVDGYLALHERARLGAKEDKKKGKLAQDSRLHLLRRLAQIDMMPGQQLHELESRLLSLRTCHVLTRAELETDPLCPHCNFRPAEEPAVPLRAGEVPARIDEDLDRLLDEWTRTLLGNLADPTIQANLDLLGEGKGRDAIARFLDTQELPDPLEPAFLKALQEVLQGLEKVVLDGPALLAALVEGGTPCTPAELRERFEGHLRSLSRGKDEARVRIVVEGRTE